MAEQQHHKIRHSIAVETVNLTMKPFTWNGKFWIITLVAVALFGLYAYIMQLKNGLIETNMRDYVSWGTYMANFVFFIGISHAGTLISAILRVTNAEWRRPITRMAEAITVFALIVGASMVLIDMGRPDRIHHVLIYGRMQSPILWDVCAVTTYLTGSLIYLYVAMIPDLTLMATISQERGKTRMAKLYKMMSIGFRNTPTQLRRLNISLATMAVIIIPVAVSVHTVVSWVFAMTLRPGWHSTIFGPYFVIGAIYSGTAAIIVAMFMFRRYYHLEKYLTNDAFRKLGTLLMAIGVIYIYFTLCEYLTAWYGGLETEASLLRLLMGEGPYAGVFWFTIITGMFLPTLLLAIPFKKPLGWIVFASVLVNIGMWLKRYIIVVPTMETPYIPAKAAGVTINYFPSWVEISITAAAFAVFILLYIFFAKLFPILSVTEIAEPLEHAEQSQTSRAGAEGSDGHRVSSPLPGGAAMMVAVAALCLGFGASSAKAVQGNEKPVPKIVISQFEEDEVNYLSALVTVDDEPVEGVEVSFGVIRTFGELPLGSEESFDDGVAAVEFPLGLPGDGEGRLQIVARMEETDEYAAVETKSRIPGGVVVVNVEEPIPQALWSQRQLWPLVAVIGVLLAGVWGTYSFVLIMLYKISHEEVQS